MKTLLVFESLNGKLLSASMELISFASALGSEVVGFMVGDASDLPGFTGKLYLADSAIAGDYNPKLHKELLLQAIDAESPDAVVFLHSSYGWDLAPRVAFAKGAGQLSEIIEVDNGDLITNQFNGKLRRKSEMGAGLRVLTVQAGAFQPAEAAGTPEVVKVSAEVATGIKHTGFEAKAAEGPDLTKAEVIVSAGRGIGKPEAIETVRALAKVLGGELGSSRPVVDAGWLDHSHQVGTTGQIVSPKLYIACGISGAVQHLAGMKKSEFIVAINTDKDAPIGEVADLFVVADLKEFLPVLTQKLGG